MKNKEKGLLRSRGGSGGGVGVGVGVVGVESCVSQHREHSGSTAPPNLVRSAAVDADDTPPGLLLGR